MEIRGSVSLTINLSRRERRRGGIIKRAKKGARGSYSRCSRARNEERRSSRGLEGDEEKVGRNKNKWKSRPIKPMEEWEEGRGDISPSFPTTAEKEREDLRKSAAASTLVTMDANVLCYTNNSQSLTKIMPAMIGRRYRASNPTGCFIWRA